MENLINFENNFTQSINRLEAQISHLVTHLMIGNKKTLPTQFLTILDSPSHIDRSQESWYLKNYNYDSISSYQPELDQF